MHSQLLYDVKQHYKKYSYLQMNYNSHKDSCMADTSQLQYHNMMLHKDSLFQLILADLLTGNLYNQLVQNPNNLDMNSGRKSKLR